MVAGGLNVSLTINPEDADQFEYAQNEDKRGSSEGIHQCYHPLTSLFDRFINTYIRLRAEIYFYWNLPASNRQGPRRSLSAIQLPLPIHTLDLWNDRRQLWPNNSEVQRPNQCPMWIAWKRREQRILAGRSQICWSHPGNWKIIN